MWQVIAGFAKGGKLHCDLPPFAFQYAAFCRLKGHVLQCKTWRIAKLLIVSELGKRLQRLILWLFDVLLCNVSVC